jgi:hypothetical protein
MAQASTNLDQLLSRRQMLAALPAAAAAALVPAAAEAAPAPADDVEIIRLLAAYRQAAAAKEREERRPRTPAEFYARLPHRRRAVRRMQRARAALLAEPAKGLEGIAAKLSIDPQFTRTGDEHWDWITAPARAAFADALRLAGLEGV